MKNSGILSRKYHPNPPTYLYIWGKRRRAVLKMVDILKKETPYVIHSCKAIFISCVADDLSLHSSLFSIFYICPSSSRWKLSSSGYYTSPILTNSSWMPTQHGPARGIRATRGLCSGSAVGLMPQSVPPVLCGRLGDVKYRTLLASLCPAHTQGFPEEPCGFASSHWNPGSAVIPSLHQHFT